MPALALRRAEAAAALGVSLETFDQRIRPHVEAVRVGTVTIYPVAELQRFLAGQPDGQYDGHTHEKVAPRGW